MIARAVILAQRVTCVFGSAVLFMEFSLLGELLPSLNEVVADPLPKHKVFDWWGSPAQSYVHEYTLVSILSLQWCACSFHRTFCSWFVGYTKFYKVPHS